MNENEPGDKVEQSQDNQIKGEKKIPGKQPFKKDDDKSTENKINRQNVKEGLGVKGKGKSLPIDVDKMTKAELLEMGQKIEH